MPALLDIDDLRTRIHTPRGHVDAVDGVSLSVERGSVLGLVGESGSGKSMLGRTIMDLLPRDGTFETTGRILLEGRDLCALPELAMQDVRGREIAMVFQDPRRALNPVKRVGEQVAETIRRHTGLSARAAKSEAEHFLDAVGIPSPKEHARRYPHQLSGGLCQRVVIAIALSAEPKLLIADEPTTALDVTIQAQILELLAEAAATRDMGMLLISHDLAVVAGYADKVCVMYSGRLVEQGPVDAVLERPKMPYTLALMRSAPGLGSGASHALEAIPGQPPDPLAPPSGCRFHPRCTRASEKCADAAPELAGDGDHRFACWHPLADARDDDRLPPPAGDSGFRNAGPDGPHVAASAHAVTTGREDP